MRAHLPLVRESEVRGANKKGMKKNQNEVARTEKGLNSPWRGQKRAIVFVLKINC